MTDDVRAVIEFLEYMCMWIDIIGANNNTNEMPELLFLFNTLTYLLAATPICAFIVELMQILMRLFLFEKNFSRVQNDLKQKMLTETVTRKRLFQQMILIVSKIQFVSVKSG